MNTHSKIGKVTPKLAIVEPMPYPINDQAVIRIEKMLERCKSGEYRSIGICAINARGYVHSAFAIDPNENTVLMLGAVNWLSDRIMDKVNES